jgi:ribosomal protein S18 acetylase RimI-like enzyme
MSPDVRLRPMTQAEYDAYYAPAVRSLAEEEAEAYGFDLVEAHSRATAAFDRLIPDRTLSASRQAIYVIELEATSVGMIWYELRNENREAYLYDLRIWPEFRGRGYGRLGLLALEALLRESGVKRIILNVFSRNAVARSLYDSLGYTSRSSLMMKAI